MIFIDQDLQLRGFWMGQWNERQGKSEARFANENQPSLACQWLKHASFVCQDVYDGSPWPACKGWQSISSNTQTHRFITLFLFMSYKHIIACFSAVKYSLSLQSSRHRFLRLQRSSGEKCWGIPASKVHLQGLKTLKISEIGI